ncbi:MAG: hypothetical protein AAGB29_06290 [Planctomycetota bacterium]
MKKLNFADLYLEKIILAVALLLALAGIYLLVFSSPNRVEINNREMNPGDVPELLTAKADDLRIAINSPQQLPPISLPEHAVILASRDAARPAARASLEPIGSIGSIEGGQLQNLDPYDLPMPPLARDAVARQGTAVLELTGDDTVDQPLLRLLNVENEPFDFRYVTVGATFDLADWRNRLESGDPQVRPAWWKEVLEDVTGVYLERQELLDPAKDEWSEPVRLDPIRPLDALPPDLDVSANDDLEVQAALQAIRIEQDFYRQAPFVRVAQPYLLKDPFTELRSDDEERDLEDLFSDLDFIDKQLERIDQQIERMQGRIPPGLVDRENKHLDDRIETMDKINELIGESLLDPTLMAMPDRSAEIAAYERGQQDRRASRPQQRRDAGVSEQMMMERMMMEEQMMMAEEMAMRGGGGDRAGMMASRGSRSQFNTRSRVQPRAQPQPRRVDPRRFMSEPDEIELEPEENPDEVRVWAHDVTVEPGKTYRYRVVVTVRNPLFRQTSVPPEQKAENYDRLTLGPSEEDLHATADASSELGATVWSNPVTIQPELYYFLVGSQAKIAIVEVWRVYDGRWREAEFRVSPGDPIGGTAEIEIDEEKVALAMKADDIAVDVVSPQPGAVGGGVSELIVVSGTTGDLDARRTNAGKDVIDRIKLLNENRVNEMIEEVQDPSQFAVRGAR